MAIAHDDNKTICQSTTFDYGGMSFSFAMSAEPDTIQAAIARAGRFYEAPELELLRKLIPVGARIVDVGANIGNHAVFFDRVCSASRVTLFEANLEVVPELRANVARNRCAATDLSHLGVALGRAPGRARLAWSPIDRATRNRGGMRVAEDATGSVTIARLDSFDLGPIDLMKIDVEGMALDVLEGASGLFDGGQRPVIFVEIETRQAALLEAWAGRYGYRLRAITTMYEGLLNIVCIADAPPIEPGVVPGRWPIKTSNAELMHNAISSQVLSERGVPEMPIGIPRIEPESLGLQPDQYERLRNVFDVQSCVFSCEIMPTIWNLYPNGLHHLSMLDVGSRTGAGAELLRYIHHPASFSRIKLDLTAIDIDDTYRDYSRFLFPDLNYIFGDIFSENFQKRFDLVLCSHCIEHVPDPVAFLRRMQDLARHWVIVATPFNEKDLIPGHLHRFDFEFFEQVGAAQTHVYRSLTWHGSMACIAVFRGNAE